MFMKMLRMPVSVFSLNCGLGRSRLSADDRFRQREHLVHRDLEWRETRCHALGHGHVHRQQLYGHVIRDDRHQRQERDGDKPRH